MGNSHLPTKPYGLHVFCRSAPVSGFEVWSCGEGITESITSVRGSEDQINIRYFCKRLVTIGETRPMKGVVCVICQVYLGSLLAGCLDFDFLGLYGLYDIGATSLTSWRGPEDS